MHLAPFKFEVINPLGIVTLSEKHQHGPFRLGVFPNFSRFCRVCPFLASSSKRSTILHSQTFMRLRLCDVLLLIGWGVCWFEPPLKLRVLRVEILCSCMPHIACCHNQQLGITVPFYRFIVAHKRSNPKGDQAKNRARFWFQTAAECLDARGPERVRPRYVGLATSRSTTRSGSGSCSNPRPKRSVV